MIQEDKLAEIVGAANVIYNQATLDEYSKDMSFVKALRPYCVIKPTNSGDIKEIIDLANETLTPLVPISSGSPHFRGDTVPSIGGSAIVDLSRMKKIAKINRPNRVAMVEPGTTFDELIPEVEREGLRLNLPLLPRKSKSVVGSLLEREPVVMPKYQWDIADPLACIEVIFGTGDTFRTGAAAGPGTIEEQWAAGAVQKAPYGPDSVSWHRLVQGAQGTMGIVTWASIRCELLPKLEEPFVIGSSKLDRMLELVHWLIRLRLVNECLVLNNSNLGAIMAEKWPEDYHNMKNALPPWLLFFNIVGYDYYPEDRVSYQIKNMVDITRRVGVEAVKAIGGVSAAEILKVVQRPSSEPYWKLRYKGGCRDISFLAIYDKLEGLIGVMYDLANKAGYPASDMGIYLQPIVQGTSCHCEFDLFYDPENPSDLERVKGLSTLATKSLMGKGAFFSRPYGENARMIVNRDAVTVAALGKIKKILDPNNIMNPGKLCF